MQIVIVPHISPAACGAEASIEHVVLKLLGLCSVGPAGVQTEVFVPSFTVAGPRPARLGIAAVMSRLCKKPFHEGPCA